MNQLTLFEQQLQKYVPAMFALHMLMKDEMDGGGGDRKLTILIDALLEYNSKGATGMVMIDYSKGKINNIDARVRLTAGTGLPSSK